MPRFTFNRTDPEVDRAREALLAVVAGLRRELEANRRDTAGLLAEVGAMRKEIASLPSQWDAAGTRVALEVVADANRRTGIEQVRAELLTDDERLFALAGEMAAAGAGELLQARDEANAR